MDMQQLITYVEELTFKTSMLGYDKDEVDMQLDKICDEIEDIVKAKDQEIETLKKGAGANAPLWEKPDETETEPEVSKQPEGKQVEQSAESSQELEELRAELTAAKAELVTTKAELSEVQKQAEQAKQQAGEARKEAESAKAAAKPATTDEAYERYMKNADLLCKQLSDLENREAGILASAAEKAQKEREQAQKEAQEIISEARKTAESIIKDAQAQKEAALEEAKKLHEENLMKAAKEQKHCDELTAQKEAIAKSLQRIMEETNRLVEKIKA
ncbi:MAG: hypothetical protein SPF99_10315 [Anaerobutyricum sp.]|nr:hypothetical protein [Anaerobutyricum sp.]